MWVLQGSSLQEFFSHFKDEHYNMMACMFGLVFCENSLCLGRVKGEKYEKGDLGMYIREIRNIEYFNCF